MNDRTDEWEQFDYDSKEVDIDNDLEQVDIDDDFEHYVHKEIPLHYWTELDGDELKVNDEPLGEREAGYRDNVFEYGEYFCCNCGERFWNKEEAKDYLINTKEQSD